MSVVLEGVGLHCGRPCKLTLSAHRGPTSLSTATAAAPFRGARIVRADRGVALEVEAPDVVIDLVEHLAAALGALALHHGVRCEVHGGEVPLMDGGAKCFAGALNRLDVEPRAAALAVLRPGKLVVGESRYEFEPSPETSLEVEVDFPGVGVQHARWNGDAESFVDEIAAARTFGYVSDARALRSAGRAAAPDPRSVALLANDGTVLGDSPGLAESELARHKLLDLVGDLFLFGGPPRGRLRTWRPGHARTHEALRRALEEGIVGS